MTADACGIPVTAGPIEATALGNIGLQAIGVGALDSVQALRSLIAHSNPLEQYQPKNTTDSRDSTARNKSTLTNPFVFHNRLSQGENRAEFQRVSE